MADYKGLREKYSVEIKNLLHKNPALSDKFKTLENKEAANLVDLSGIVYEYKQLLNNLQQPQEIAVEIIQVPVSQEYTPQYSKNLDNIAILKNDEMQKLNSNIDELSRQIGYNNEIDELKQYHIKIENQLNEKINEIQELTDKQKYSDNEIQTLNQRLRDMELSKNANDSELDMLISNSKTAAAERAAIETELLVEKTKIQNIQIQLAQLNDEKNDLQQQLIAAQRPSKELITLRIKTFNIQNDLKDKDARIKDLEAENKQSVDNIANIQHQLTIAIDIEQKQKDYIKNLNKILEHKEQYNSKLNDLNNAQTHRITVYKNLNDMYIKRIDEIENKLKNTTIQLDDERGQLKKARDKINDLSNQLDEQSSRIKKLNLEAWDAKTIESEREALISELQENNTHYIGELGRLTNIIYELYNKLNEKGIELSEEAHNLDNLSAELERNQMELFDATNKIEAYKIEVRDANDMKQRAERELTDEKFNSANLLAQNAQLQINLQQKRQKEYTDNEMLEDTLRLLRESEAKLTSIRIENENIRRAAINVSNQNTEYLQEVKDLHNEIQQKNDEIVRIRQQLEDEITRNNENKSRDLLDDAFNTPCPRDQSQIDRLKRELSDEKNRKKTLVRDIDAKDKILQKNIQEIAMLNIEINELNRQITESGITPKEKVGIFAKIKNSIAHTFKKMSNPKIHSKISFEEESKSLLSSAEPEEKYLYDELIAENADLKAKNLQLGDKINDLTQKLDTIEQNLTSSSSSVETPETCENLRQRIRYMEGQIKQIADKARQVTISPSVLGGINGSVILSGGGFFNKLLSAKWLLVVCLVLIMVLLYIMFFRSPAQLSTQFSRIPYNTNYYMAQY